MIVKKILLAAGISKRFGNNNKLLENFNGKPLINHILDKLLEIYDTSELLIILGYEQKKIKNLINNKHIKTLENMDYKKGIGSSIALGVKNLETKIRGVMIFPTDMPYIDTKDIINLEKKFLEMNCKKVIIPKYNSRSGNPVILPSIYFSYLKNLKGDFGAKTLIKEKDIIYFKTGIGTIIDIDTREELNKAKLNLIS